MAHLSAGVSGHDAVGVVQHLHGFKCRGQLSSKLNAMEGEVLHRVERDCIACGISGDLSHIKELGLWHPNEAYVKLDRLYREQYEQRVGQSKFRGAGPALLCPKVASEI